jgi:hypothetical protein
MDDDQNWYRQLLGLILLSASRAAVEFITKPGSRAEATEQLKGAFREIDYDAAARAITNAIDTVATTSKGRLSETIDTLRDRSVDAVDEAKVRAEKQLGQKKKGKKMRFVVGLLLGGLIAYFVLDEQRRDALLDRITGASGPIHTTAYNAVDQVSSTVQEAVPPASTPETTTESTGSPDEAAP